MHTVYTHYVSYTCTFKHAYLCISVQKHIGVLSLSNKREAKLGGVRALRCSMIFWFISPATSTHTISWCAKINSQRSKRGTYTNTILMFHLFECYSYGILFAHQLYRMCKNILQYFNKCIQFINSKFMLFISQGHAYVLGKVKKVCIQIILSVHAPLTALELWSHMSDQFL